jgi:energy-coupling factor transporter transmembrane protein EcfT
MLRFRHLNLLASITLIVICVASTVFLSPFLELVIFSFTLMVYILLKYDARLFLDSALFFIIISALLLSTGNSIIANETAIIAYYFFVLGVLDFLIDYLRATAKPATKLRKR